MYGCLIYIFQNVDTTGLVGACSRPMNTTNQTTAVAYYRTSSATNVGTDKDSLKRQQDAVHSYAAANGISIVKEYYDAAVSGADPVTARPGFVEMLTYMLGN